MACTIAISSAAAAAALLALFTTCNAAFFFPLQNKPSWPRKDDPNIPRINCQSSCVVDQLGRGNFTTIQAAIDGVPPGNARWICIRIQGGIYREQVKIPMEKPFIYLVGESQQGQQPTIVWDGHGDITDATLVSQANNTRAIGLTFMNSYNYGSRNPIAPAVAAMVEGDKVAFYNCRFLGVQDTLWDVGGRHYFYGCTIEGAVDFIFGSGQSIYEQCSIAVNVDSIGPGFIGYVTAQGREQPNETNGFVFINCHIDGKGKVFLGRPWHSYARVIFYRTIMSQVVVPQGWDAWKAIGHEYQLTFSEIDSRGGGANTRGRVGWANKKSFNDLQPFIDMSYIDQGGWLQAAT